MNDLSWFIPWTPLSELPFAVSILGENIYGIEPSVYVYGVDYNEAFENDHHGPYATVVIFAPSLGAVERTMNHELKFDRGEALNLSVIPPIGLNDWSYAGLSRLKGISESAAYSGKTGEFVELSLRWRAFLFCFRERELSGEETPYVVHYSPKA